ncbi:MAG: retroviral-like aspartic protease family protein [Stigonema ocellatum SAG 48.90 = DSM 106950]|nr:retroviral-like aspartic protease family protein [Stigonema ocellatum SAG 48.90 = DSM 106950]
MLQSFLSRASLIFLTTTIAVLAVACREEKHTTATAGKEQHPLTEESAVHSPITAAPVPSPTSSSMLPSEFEQGLDKATSAFSISQSAQSTEDWNLVVRQLQDAIALMEAVPVNSPYFPNAQTKILEFQHLLQSAQKQATPTPIVQPIAKPQPKKIVVVVPQASAARKKTLPLPQTLASCDLDLDPNSKQCPPLSRKEKLPPPITILPQPQLLNQQQEVFAAPIKRRIGGTPIIEVTFNGNQQFEMILDTGASGTVITQNMATSLGVMQVGKAKANTASSKAVEFPIGYVDSIEVGGVLVSQVPVAIAGPDLETGLLGHDFFGEYDLTIKRDVVEFRPQSQAQRNSAETELASPSSTKDRLSVEFP